MIRRAFAGVLLAVAACGGGDEASDYAATKADAEQVERQLPIVTDSAATAALEAIGSSLVDASGPREHPWRFRLVEDTTLNAFALPGGFVYVHTATVKAAHDVDELAGVMGHEVAHARLRHGAKQRDSQAVGTVAISLFCGLTGWCSGAVAQTVIRVGATAAFAKYSRADELQADSAGLLYAARAGYDPRGIVLFFETLQASEGERGPGALRFFASHPMEKTRIARAKALIAAQPPVTGAAAPAMRAAFAVVHAAVVRGALPATVPVRTPADTVNSGDSTRSDSLALRRDSVPPAP
ncbi:MAG: M48 family metalloprotease [Gemmatimonadetes bacterium]|nr:M48 family metalloprotease [Gemmatimonadota bacterium]